MKQTRKGLGLGKGSGYYNMLPMDSHIHSLSARGVKTRYDVEVYNRLQAVYPDVFRQKSFKDKKSATDYAKAVYEEENPVESARVMEFKSGKGKIIWDDGEKLSAKGKTLKAMGGSEPVEVIRKGNKRAEIYVDEEPESPREWDNVGHMVAFHNRYELGDKTDLNSDMFNSWGDLQKYLFETKKAVVVLPLYIYDHSGLRMKVGDFKGQLPQGHYEFDSGQVGFIYTTKEDIKNMLGVNKVTDKVRKRAEKILKGEVETYDQYLIGDVYGFKIFEEKPVTITKKYGDGTKKIVKTNEDEEVDSVWGFFGIDNAIAEAKDSMR